MAGVVFLFPGQGALRPGAATAWVDTPAWRIVDEISESVGRDVGRLLLEADAPTLQATDNAQPATFALSVVALEHLRSLGAARPRAVAGHSLGEYSALLAAGVLSLADGARLVGRRGDAMRTAAERNPGSMAAVLGAEPDAVAEVCDSVEGAWLANDNAPGQVVIAGTMDGLDRAGAAAKQAGASRVMPLPVGGAFHSPLMQPAQEPLDAAIAATMFASASAGVVANVDAEPHAGADFARLLSTQLCHRVNWRRSLLRLAADGADTFVEIGPGDALTGMVKRTLPDAARHTVGTPEQALAAVAALAP